MVNVEADVARVSCALSEYTSPSIKTIPCAFNPFVAYNENDSSRTQRDAPQRPNSDPTKTSEPLISPLVLFLSCEKPHWLTFHFLKLLELILCSSQQVLDA